MKNSRWIGSLMGAPLALAGCSPQTANDGDAAATSITSDAASAPGGGSQVVPDGLSATEVQAITLGFQQQLQQLEFRNFNTGYRVACSSMYTVAVPIIKDTQLNGTTGKLRVAAQITAMRPNIERTAAGPVYANFFPDACYGDTADHWHEGEVATAMFEVNVEHWSSGWRLSQQQNLRPLPI